MRNTDLYPNLGDESKANNDQRYTNRQPAKYGPIPGILPGAVFKDRDDCVQAGVHVVRFAGIHGSKEYGACSVCLSGGYEDDADKGESFTYTGTGGQRDSFSGDHVQVKDQSFTHPNNACLVTSKILNNPVRVVRGSRLNSFWAPTKGYRYDGLYLVEDFYLEEGVSGYQMCKFEFRRVKGQTPIPERQV